MATPEEILRAQRILSIASGAKKLSHVMACIAFSGLVLEFLVHPQVRGDVLRVISHWLFLGVIAMLLKRSSARRMRDAQMTIS
jgi:hypothetical protein